jgi:hypothetical protein
VVYERLRQYTPEAKTPHEQAAAVALTREVFDYHRMGHDRRLLQFLPDGIFGEGAGGCETTWDMNEEGGTLRLTIFGSNCVTCRLEKCGDGAWHGAWLIGEKMPVKLTPLSRAPTKTPPTQNPKTKQNSPNKWTKNPGGRPHA